MAGSEVLAPSRADPAPAPTADVIALPLAREGRVQLGDNARHPPVHALAAGSPASEGDALSGLIARTAIGDRGAFRAVFELARSPLFGICLRMLSNRGEAEEALQDAFVRVWQHAGGFSGGANNAMAWLRAITRNRCLEILRRRGVDDADWSDEIAEAIVDDAPDPETAAVRAQTAHTIFDCLTGLAPAERQAIELAFYDGLSYSEVAERLARPGGTVKSQIRRALARLKDCLQRP